MNIDATTRQQIVIAALSATGDQRQNESGEAWEARAVRNAATFAAVVSNDRHPLFKAVDQVDNAKVFTGTVVSIVKEQSSTRGIVTLHTGTTRTEDGTEQVRTERTDNLVGKHMAIEVRGLVGHDVVVWVEVEAIGDGSKKSRVLRHIADRGINQETQAA